MPVFFSPLIMLEALNSDKHFFIQILDPIPIFPSQIWPEWIQIQALNKILMILIIKSVPFAWCRDPDPPWSEASRPGREPYPQDGWSPTWGFLAIVLRVRYYTLCRCLPQGFKYESVCFGRIRARFSKYDWIWIQIWFSKLDLTINFKIHLKLNFSCSIFLPKWYNCIEISTK